MVAFDQDADELAAVTEMFGAMRRRARCPAGPRRDRDHGRRARACRSRDGEFDRVIAAEVLEHIPRRSAGDRRARPGAPAGRPGRDHRAALAARAVCWALSDEYHEVHGGHVRIYTRDELDAKLARAGLTARWHHHAHGLHSPYWWLKCAVGVDNDEHPLTRRTTGCWSGTS